jgi:predicted membrane protein
METKNRKQLGNSFWLGIIVVAIGALLLLDRLDYDLVPYWLISWKTLLIAIGVAIGIRKNFQGIGWIVLIVVGSFFFIEDIPGVDFEVRRYVFPVVVISVGLVILFRSTFSKSVQEAKNRWIGDSEKKSDLFTDSSSTGENQINITSIFGGSKRRIFSKNFRGGQVTSIFGGTEIDLSQADIEGTVVVDMVNVFGGCKLIVPSNWELRSDITAILGGVDDKRKDPTAYSPSKKLVLTGVCMFGGVEIKSY